MNPLAKWLRRHVPLLNTWASYGQRDLRGDIAAGLTVAVMLVPQAMAYAMLAGLPPIVGLYASMLPLAVYALFGTSRELSVGPVAMVSLMVAAGVGTLAETGSEAYVGLAVLLAGMVGLIQLGMGLARLGFMVNFLSHPVVSGFTSAAALIIGLSQLKHLLGVDLPRSHHVHTIVMSALDRLGETNPLTLGIGVGSVGALLLLKRLRPAFPGALVVVVVGTVLVKVLGLHELGVAIVGEVPAGLPPLAMPAIGADAVRQLLPMAVAISFVGFMESISVAKAFASKNHYEVEANKELIALGLANVAGSLFSAYPVTGGFSRTAVNAQAGARSGMSSLVAAAVVTVTLLLLTPLFHFLPKAVLAAIIMVAVLGLVDVGEVRHLWRVKRTDLMLLLITFVATLAIGIEAGILAGVGSSIMTVMVRTTRPNTAVLGRVPGSHAYRSIERFPDAVTCDRVLAVRIDAQFYFGNVNFLKETLRKLQAEQTERTEPPRVIVINAASINQIDSSADRALHEIAHDLKAHGVELFFAEVRGPVMDVMRRSGLVTQLGENHFFLTVRRAVEYAQQLTKPAASSSPTSRRLPSVASASPEGVGPEPLSTPDGAQYQEGQP